MFTAAPRTLYVVATPIGNLGDLAPRALDILRSVSFVLAEDTRVFSKLAASFGFSASCRSFHEHNEQRLVPEIVRALQTGQSAALTTDAGTPLISDPGYRLVNACRAAELPVSTVPGPCAAIAALSISGFETDRFVFSGFLPQRDGKRYRALQTILESGDTTVVYESPHRIAKTLAAIADIEPSRQIFLARELTKLHEETLSGTAAQLRQLVDSRAGLKGEIVLVIRKRQD